MARSRSLPEREALSDSVIDANVAAMAVGVATGIVFEPDNPSELERALGRAFDLFADRARWQSLIRAAMRQPVGWRSSAEAYKAVYQAAREDRRAPRDQ